MKKFILVCCFLCFSLSCMFAQKTILLFGYGICDETSYSESGDLSSYLSIFGSGLNLKFFHGELLGFFTSLNLGVVDYSWDVVNHYGTTIPIENADMKFLGDVITGIAFYPELGKVVGIGLLLGVGPHLDLMIIKFKDKVSFSHFSIGAGINADVLIKLGKIYLGVGIALSRDFLGFRNAYGQECKFNGVFSINLHIDFGFSF